MGRGQGQWPYPHYPAWSEWWYLRDSSGTFSRCCAPDRPDVSLLCPAGCPGNASPHPSLLAPRDGLWSPCHLLMLKLEWWGVCARNIPGPLSQTEGLETSSPVRCKRSSHLVLNSNHTSLCVKTECSNCWQGFREELVNRFCLLP